MIKIRKLDSDDAKIYQTIRLQALKESQTSFSSSYEEEKDRDITSIQDRLSQSFAHTYGAFDEQLLVGIISFVAETRIKTRHTADIYGMYVDSNYRNQGIGKALLNHVMIEAKKRGIIEKIRLSVTESNKDAIRLYESVGFKIYGYEKNSMKIDQTYYNTCFMEIHL
ncbi:MAG: GNAT family N-acetyltransferase [Bacillota bacterium]|nr:MAG: GNAT family N-acetyltransferase [Bacillota bacterium]